MRQVLCDGDMRLAHIFASYSYLAYILIQHTEGVESIGRQGRYATWMTQLPNVCW